MLSTSLLLAFWMGRAAESDARDLAREIAERQAVEVLNFISPIMDQGRALAAAYEASILSGGEISRNEFGHVLRQMVARTDAFLGVWAAFTVDGFDGPDALWANADKSHDATGRYMPYYYRTAGGIEMQPCSDPERAKWYTVPRDTKKDYLTSPYTFKAGGKTVLGIDSCIPVLVNGNFRGVVGLDYNVTSFMDMAASITPFGSGKAYIVADNDSFVGTPDKSMMGKPMQDAFGEEMASRVHDAVASGKELSLDFEQDGVQWHRIFVPIDVTGGGQYWGLGVDIPLNVVLAGSKAMLYRAVGISLGVILLLCVLIWFLARSIARPICRASSLAELIRKGDLSERIEYDAHDEIGVLARSLNHMAEGLEDKAQLAQAIASNDLTAEVEIASEKDVLGKALRQMSRNLNGVLGSVLQSALEVDSGAGQVSAASEALSQGATEQAASLEQITSSLTQVSSQTRENAENASRASRNANAVRGRADTGYQDLEHMVEAMREVSESSQAIAKIIKVIDEIAFQTNLLALNAAVEAARAGQHGKGFAVVAEEVRNLASRSAKAAQETAQLIEGSGERVRRTSEMVGQTAEGMQAVVAEVAEVATLVDAIAQASSEQSHALMEVTQGLQQVDTVTQRNTANAEQTSSAAQELSSQAGLLRSLLANFRLRGGADQQAPSEASSARRTASESSRLRVQRKPPQSLPQGNKPAAPRRPVDPKQGSTTPQDAWGAETRPQGKGAPSKPVARREATSGEPEVVIHLDDDKFGRY
ncbi:MAG: methyl-accepting chemotaxis protein [Desulfovibrio sp.]